MGRGTARPRIQGAYNGPLQYRTQEVRHLLRLHGQTMGSFNDPMMPTSNRRGRALSALQGLRIGSDLQKVAGKMGSDKVKGSEMKPDQANRLLRELNAELQKYRQSIEQSGDRMSRSTHVRTLTEILVDQEERARELFAAGKAPPMHVIVTAATMRAAGMRADEMRAVCDRGLPWRVWESTAWNTRALRQNQEACARDMNRITTGINVPQPWLVQNQGELIRLRAHMGANR